MFLKNRIRIAIPGYQAFENYMQAVRLTGEAIAVQKTGSIAEEISGFQAVPVLVGEDRCGCGKSFLPQRDFSVNDFDGLILPGGGDIASERYGETNFGSEGIDEELDELQLSVLDAFVCAGKPVLGICRGHQLVNVYFGGTLIQDIPEREAHVRIGNTDNAHDVLANRGSLLEQLYGLRFAVNSAHHQAIDRIGKGLIITAYCKDGVAEAAEHEQLPVRTVQFHPERMAFSHSRTDTVNGQKVFEKFLLQCI